MAMTGFICHDNYYDRLQRLTDEEVGHLFRQLMLYHAGREDEMTDFIGMEGLAFDFISSDIDRIEEKHNATSETNRLNGLKGGRPKKRTEPDETDKNPQKPTETEENQTKAYKDKDKDIDKEKENKNIRRFTPPTLEEVTAYCRERNNSVDPEKFIAFYASKGWKVGNQPMKDWKMCIITWEKRDKVPVKVVPAQDYTQRETVHTEEDIRKNMLAMMQEAGVG